MSKRLLVLLSVLFAGGLIMGCAQDSGDGAEGGVADSIGGAMESAGESMSDAADAMGDAGTEEGTYIGMVRHNIETITSALGGD